MGQEGLAFPSNIFYFGVSYLPPFPSWPDAVLSYIFSPLDLLAGTWIHRGTEEGGWVRGKREGSRSDKDNKDESQNHLDLHCDLILWRNTTDWCIATSLCFPQLWQQLNRKYEKPYCWHKMSRNQPLFFSFSCIFQWAQNTQTITDKNKMVCKLPGFVILILQCSINESTKEKVSSKVQLIRNACCMPQMQLVWVGLQKHFVKTHTASCTESHK